MDYDVINDCSSTDSVFIEEDIQMIRDRGLKSLP